MALAIGLMSGTSIDGIDGALIRFDREGRPAQTLAFCSLPFPDPLREALERLQRPFEGELDASALAGIDLARRYADVVSSLIEAAGVRPGDVLAIGAHGQTVRHRPEAGYTIQLLDPGLLAESTGIDVIADLRRADIVAGGQGAPLVPAFHAEVFGKPGQDRAVVNIGGIANVSLLGGTGEVLGFDTGPGNTLLDAWCRRHTGRPFDEDGRWAASGKVDDALLARWLAHPYFASPAPKSTGRDLFNIEWLLANLHPDAGSAGGSTIQPGDASTPGALRPENVQATLVALTASTIVAALVGTRSEAIYLCGGGVKNGALTAAIRAGLSTRAGQPAITIEETSALGIDPQAVEASAFAWLAIRHMMRLAGNLPSVTGARGPRVLGAYHPSPARVNEPA